MSANEVPLGKNFRLLILAPFTLLLLCAVYAGWVWKRTESQMTQVIEAKLQMAIADSPPSAVQYLSGASISLDFQRISDAVNSFNHRYGTLMRADSKNDIFTSEAAPIIQEAERLMRRGDSSVTGYGRPYNDLGPLQIILSQTFQASLQNGDTERAMSMLNLMKWQSSPDLDQVSEQEYFYRQALVKPFHRIVLHSLQSDQWNDDQLATLASWMEPNKEWQTSRQSATQNQIAQAHRDYLSSAPSLGWGKAYSFPVAPGERHQWTEPFFNDASYQEPADIDPKSILAKRETRSFTCDRWLSVPFLDQNPWSNLRWRHPSDHRNSRWFDNQRQRSVIAKAIMLRQHHRQTGVWLEDLPTLSVAAFE